MTRKRMNLRDAGPVWGEVFRKDQILVNEWLERALTFGSDVPTRLARAMRYAVLGPGKRVRPILCLETYKAAIGQSIRHKVQGAGFEARCASEVGPICCGVEMIHAFSLVHDDLPSMDDDDFRRGQPSLHRKFDEGTAILAADALFALAFEAFSRSRIPAERRIAVIAEIAAAVGPRGMAGGQMMDIANGRSKARKTGAHREEHTELILIQEKKTADFIAASVACGAIAAGAPDTVVGRLRRAGLALGRLFQLTDDILDVGRNEKVNSARLCGVRYAKERAGREARTAERMFLGQGPDYALLAGMPEIILARRA